MTIYGYTRVSTMEQETNTSLKSQRSIIEGTAQANEIEGKIVWLQDVGVSGATEFLMRKSLAPKVLRAGDVIIVAKLDRFSRDPRTCLNAVHELKQRKVSLVINGHGDVTSPTNIMGKLMLEIMAVFAGHEREVIVERVTRGQRAKRAKGGYGGGRPPFGMVSEGQGVDSKVVEDKVMAAKISDFNWKKGLAKDFLIYRMAGLRKRGMVPRKISTWVENRYSIKISHVTVKKLTDLFERTNLNEQCAKAQESKKFAKSEIRQAAAVKLGLNPKRFA